MRYFFRPAEKLYCCVNFKILHNSGEIRMLSFILIFQKLQGNTLRNYKTCFI